MHVTQTHTLTIKMIKRAVKMLSCITQMPMWDWKTPVFPEALFITIRFQRSHVAHERTRLRSQHPKKKQKQMVTTNLILCKWTSTVMKKSDFFAGIRYLPAQHILNLYFCLELGLGPTWIALKDSPKDSYFPKTSVVFYTVIIPE